MGKLLIAICRQLIAQGNLLIAVSGLLSAMGNLLIAPASLIIALANLFIAILQPAHCSQQSACSLECATCDCIAKCQKLIALKQTARCNGATCS